MKEKPILFSGEMVRAILEGRKTMTRRIVKPQPVLNHSGAYDLGEGDFTFFHDAMAQHILENYNSPYGFAYADGTADRLWVRETFQFIPGSDGGYVYKASQNGKDWEENSEDWTWKPSIFMPREASRIILEITDIRVERLQDITEEDAIKEGIVEDAESKSGWQYEPNHFAGTAKHAFEILWDKINGKRASWESNPFVWVISFQGGGSC